MMKAQYSSAKEKFEEDNQKLIDAAKPAPQRTDLIPARFIGRDSNNKLMQFAPGNYKKNTVYLIPVRQLVYPWWKLET